MARCARVSVLSGARGAAEHALASAGRVSSAHRARWALCSLQRGEAVRGKRGRERGGQAANQVGLSSFHVVAKLTHDLGLAVMRR